MKTPPTKKKDTRLFPLCETHRVKRNLPEKREILKQVNQRDTGVVTTRVFSN